MQKCFQNDYLGDAKTEGMKTLRFTGRRIDASGFLIPSCQRIHKNNPYVIDHFSSL
jgi:hypothetical protein